MSKLKMTIAMAYWQIIGKMSSFFKPKQKQKNSDLRKQEFSSSTQEIGGLFNEKVRNNFRNRWIRTK